MIELALREVSLSITAEEGDFKPRHESQLAYWGLEHDPDARAFVASGSELPSLVTKIVAYLERERLRFRIAPPLQQMVRDQQQARMELDSANASCSQLRDGIIDQQLVKEFAAFLDTSIARPLKEHQFKAALHMLLAGNGANFSVMGSGKTSVVLVVFQKLRQLGVVDSLFVVGPPACFAPWRYEYRAVLGQDPSCQILAGGNIDDRRSRYLVDRDSVSDLYLTTFQTLHRDLEDVRALFLQRGIRFFLVVDEAHYIKQLDGVWAAAVLSVARHAARRAVLTGTPFPRSYTDAFNLFDVLWPLSSPIGTEQRHRVALHTQRNEHRQAAQILDATIGPLFYRVRKDELHLAPQQFHDPIRVRMNQHERAVYDAILDRIKFASQSDYFRDFDLLIRLRRGRMIRLRQCVSYAALLGSAVTEYSEDLVEEDASLSDIIHHYDDLEVPAKLNTLVSLVTELRADGEKIVIWSNFVQTLKLIVTRLSALGHEVGLIYGGTPFENMGVQEEFSRERIISEFTDPGGGIDILVANPAACAESISLHKTCSHAVYYDMSYNCAQYLQSVDRIHRIGGSEHRPAHYYFLQYEDSIDNDILLNVRQKARNMSAVIDQDYAIYSLDMFGEEEEVEAYARLFGPGQ